MTMLGPYGLAHVYVDCSELPYTLEWEGFILSSNDPDIIIQMLQCVERMSGDTGLTTEVLRSIFEQCNSS